MLKRVCKVWAHCMDLALRQPSPHTRQSRVSASVKGQLSMPLGQQFSAGQVLATTPHMGLGCLWGL